MFDVIVSVNKKSRGDNARSRHKSRGVY